MSKILISGYYGFANAGDEAMLTAIIESLRQVEKNVELTVLSGNPEDTAAKHQVCSVYRFNPLGIIRAMKDSELIISGGGSLLQDVTSKRIKRQVLKFSVEIEHLFCYNSPVR